MSAARLLAPSLGARGRTPPGIRVAWHPRWTAALGVAFRPGSAATGPSRRLASPAPRRSRCSGGFVHGLGAARGRTPPGIRAAWHPRWTAALRVAFRPGSAATGPSRRLASPAPRRSRCSGGFVHGLLLLLLPLAVAALWVGALSGQTPVSPGSVGASPGQAGVVAGSAPGEPSLEREVFHYPGGDRRDPFGPPPPGDAGGLGFDDIHLLGVILAADRGESVALVRAGWENGDPLRGGGERTLRLREDMLLGAMRIVRVERECLVVVELGRPDLGERREVCLNRQRGREVR